MFAIKNWEEYTYYLFIYLKDGSVAKFRSDFFQLHRNHQLRFFIMLDFSSRQKFYEIIKPSEFATVFSKLDFTAQQLVIGELDEGYVTTIIDTMRTDEIVQFLSGLEQERINYYLNVLEKHDPGQISMLLTYEANTAGAIMTTEFITATEDETVAGVLDRLKLVGKDAETIYYIYIVTFSNELLGVVSLRDLIISPRGHTMKFIMKEQVISVRIDDHLMKVVKIVKDYDLLLVPIINNNNEMMGIITIDDVMNKNTESSLETTPPISIKRQMGMLTMLFLGFALVMITTSFQFQVNVTTFIITLIGWIAVVAGTAGILSSVFNFRALAKNKLKKEAFLLFVKDELFSVFIMALTCGILSSMISIVVIKNNTQIGLTFGGATFLAIFSCTIIGALIPFLAKGMKNHRQNRGVYKRQDIQHTHNQ